MVWDPRSDEGSDDATVLSTSEAMACVCLATTHDEAVACRDLLAGHSIPAVIGPPSRQMAAGGLPVFVPEDLLAEAGDVIACFEAADDPDEWEDEPFDDDDDDDDDDDEDYDDDYDDDDDEYDDDLDDDFDDDFDDD